MTLSRTLFRPRLEQLEDKALPAVAFALATSNALLRFDTTAPSVLLGTAAVTGLAQGDNLVGIDFRPRTGQLIGLAANDLGNSDQVKLYRIEPLTGAATAIGPASDLLSGDGVYGVDFNPTVDRLRITNAAGENARFNPGTGLRADVTNDVNLNPTGQVIGVAYDRNFDRQTITSPANGAIPTTLYGIDRGTNRLVKIGGVDGVPSPNAGAVTDVGPLGITLSGVADGGFDIIPGFGLGRAFAALSTQGSTQLYSIDLGTGAATALGMIGPGPGSVFIRGLAIQPDDITAVGQDAGSAPQVIVYDARTGAEKFNFPAYVSSFIGGVRVATGDVNGDGVPDIITGAGTGGGPHIKVFDGNTGSEIRSFFAFAESFSGGVNVASGDTNADGFDDIIVGASSGSSEIRIFSGRDGTTLSAFSPFGSFSGGSRVAAGDFDLDGDAEIVAAAGIGGGSHVKVLDATGSLFRKATEPYYADAFLPTGEFWRSFLVPSYNSEFFAYDQGFSGGVYLAVGDINGDGGPDIITSPGRTGGPHVKVYSDNGSLLQSFFAGEQSFSGGSTVASADVNGDGRSDIITGAGLGTESQRTIFSAFDFSILSSSKLPGSGIFVG